MYQPAQITITDGGIFLDGGSIRIEAVDNLGITHILLFDHCFKSQDSHCTQLYLNQKIVQKNSSEEEMWLRLLTSAGYISKSGELPSLLAEPLEMDAASIAEILVQSESNPGWMSKYLVHQLITHLQSPEYHTAAQELLVRL